MKLEMTIMESTLLEKVSLGKGVTWDQMRVVLACLSFLHGLATGVESSSWKEVRAIWKSLQYHKS